MKSLLLCVLGLIATVNLGHAQFTFKPLATPAVETPVDPIEELRKQFGIVNPSPQQGSGRRDLTWDLTPTRIGTPMDTKQYPDQRKIVNGWKESFPNLTDYYEVLEPGTPSPKLTSTIAGLEPDKYGRTASPPPGTYNCIAHTGGIRNLWVNPYQTWDAWNCYYNPLGYKRELHRFLATHVEEGIQKVAIYGIKRDGNLEFTHAAIQEKDGTWTSKLGSGPLIRHEKADSVCGPSYGEVVDLYTRRFDTARKVLNPKIEPADAALLKGTWKIVKIEYDGQKQPTEGSWTFTGDKIIKTPSEDPRKGELHFVVSRSKPFGEIDFEDKWSDDKGIYKIVGDELFIAYAGFNRRPTEFSSKGQVVLVVLKRVN